MPILRVHKDQEIIDTELTRHRYLIGRLPTCDFRGTHKSLSRKHGELIRFDDSEPYSYRNMSRNGTLINGVLYQDNVKVLVSGDELAIRLDFQTGECWRLTYIETGEKDELDKETIF